MRSLQLEIAGKEDLRLTVTAYPTATRSVVVHRALDARGQPLEGWKITHEPTGFSLGVHHYPSRAQALRVAGRLRELNWEFSQGKIPDLGPYWDALRAARRLEGLRV